MSRNSSTLKFLVVGSDGQVGQALISYLQYRAIPFEAITEAEAFEEASLSAFLRTYPEHSYVVNVLFEEPADFTAHIAQQWLKTGKQLAANVAQSDRVLLQLSSGRVFSGRSPRGYHETDETDAQTPAGRCFIELEEIARQEVAKLILLRVDWLFSEQSNNFLTRLVDAAIEKEELRISNTMRGCPTDAHTVARVLVAITEQADCAVTKPTLWGTYHYADSDACSLYTFARTIITVVKSMSEVRVETVTEVDTRPEINGRKSPENHELNCRKILSTFGIKQRPWRRSVQEVLKGMLA